MSPQLQHTIAGVLLELGYLAAGVLLCYFGKDMLEKGIKGSFRGDGKAVSATFRVVTSSPGLVFMLAGLTIIAVAIVTQARFTQGAGRPAVQQNASSGDAGNANADESSLEELAETAFESVFAQPTPAQAFAQAQMEAAMRLVASDQSSALIALTNAVTVQPSLLKNALQHADLRKLTADPNFQTIVRARYRMPAPSAIPRADADAVVGRLGMFALDRRDLDGGQALKEFPNRPDLEPVARTAERLRSAVARNPRALYAMLRSPEFRWVLETEPLAAQLTSEIERLEAAGSRQ